MRKLLGTCFLIAIGSLLPAAAHAQVNLLPAINSPALPAPGDSICAFTPYIDTTQQYASTGYQAGDLLPEFYAADTGGTQYSLSGMLAAHKPVLLITGSYTCPVFRGNMQTALPQLIADFGSQIDIYIVYELEVHPQSPWISPLAGTVWNPGANTSAGIFFPQPRIYSDRRVMARLAQTQLSIPVPVLLDGPCNEWWSHFGPAADNAYLVLPDGHVFFRQGWFADPYTDLYTAVQQALAITSVPELKSGQVNIFPVPAQDAVALQLDGFSDYSVEITDATGRVAATLINRNDARLLLQRNGLPAGLYFCRVYDASGKQAISRLLFQ